MPDILYENEYYYVHITEFTDPVLRETVKGYGIYSKDTQVREGEARRLYYAAMLADKYCADTAEMLNKISNDQQLLLDMPAANEVAV